MDNKNSLILVVILGLALFSLIGLSTEQGLEQLTGLIANLGTGMSNIYKAFIDSRTVQFILNSLQKLINVFN